MYVVLSDFPLTVAILSSRLVSALPMAAPLHCSGTPARPGRRVAYGRPSLLSGPARPRLVSPSHQQVQGLLPPEAKANQH